MGDETCYLCEGDHYAGDCERAREPVTNKPPDEHQFDARPSPSPMTPEVEQQPDIDALMDRAGTVAASVYLTAAGPTSSRSDMVSRARKTAMHEFVDAQAARIEELEGEKVRTAEAYGAAATEMMETCLKHTACDATIAEQAATIERLEEKEQRLKAGLVEIRDARGNGELAEGLAMASDMARETLEEEEKRKDSAPVVESPSPEA